MASTRGRGLECSCSAARTLLCALGCLVASGGEASSHPRLWYSAADVPSLQAKIAAGPAQAAFSSMCASLGWDDWYLDGWIGRCLEEISFRYSMTGESWYATEVAAELGAIAASDPAASFDPDALAWAGAHPIPIATAYDLVFAALEPAERQAIASYLERYAELLFAALEEGARPALTGDVVMAYAGLGLTAIAIADESSHPARAAWLDAAAAQIGGNAFRDLWNPGGSCDESYGPCLTGSPEALRFAEAYRRYGGPDLLDGANILEAPAWYGYGWLPHAAHPAFGAATLLTGPAFAAEHLLTIARTQSVVGKWSWHQVHGFSGVDRLDRPSPVSGLLGVALWYPDALATIVDPMSEGFPLDRLFADTANEDAGETGFDVGAGGQLVMRSGWGSDSVALLFKVSDEWQPQSHNDSSSFVLSAYGAEMVMDPPASTLTRRSGHNVMSVGSADDDATKRASYRGALRSLSSTSWAVTTSADARYPSGSFDAGAPDDPGDDSWSPASRADRTLVFVRGPRPYLLVADDVSLDGATAALSTFHLQLGLGSWGLSGGTGAAFDPMRVEFYNGQQLLVSVLEPDAGYLASVSWLSENPYHQRLDIQLGPAVATRSLVLLQPRRWAGDPEQPWATRLAVTGGVGADLQWSDGTDRLLVRLDSTASSTAEVAADSTSTDARVLAVRRTFGSDPTAWFATDATHVVAQSLGLLDTGGLACTVSWYAGRLEVQASSPPAARQIAVYAPYATEVLLDGAPVGFVQAGSYVLLPAECGDEELCNRIDDDCDGLVDEEDAVDAPSYYLDDDGDGFGDSTELLQACVAPTGYVPVGDDCDDHDRHVNPGAVEDCFDVDDNDCNGRADEEDPACVAAAEAADTTLCTCSFVGRRSGSERRADLGTGVGATTTVPPEPLGWPCTIGGLGAGLLVWRRRTRRGSRGRARVELPAAGLGAPAARGLGAIGTGGRAAIATGGLGAIVAVLTGCEAPTTRSYAVTLTDSASMNCTGQALGLLADPVELEEAADELRRQWRSAYENAVLRPEPRVLRVNELEARVRAWFEQGTDGCPDWATASEPIGGAGPGWEDDDGGSTGGGSAGDAICAPAAFAYDDPSTVYEGEPESGYVSASYVDAVDTDEEDEAAGRYPCGARAVAEGQLSFTESDGAAGRVRWTNTRWIASDYSACEGRIDCVRNVELEGLELE